MNYLSSTAAFFFSEYLAKPADNFAMRRRSERREFKSIPLHHPVPLISEIAENRSKSARARAICDPARTQRASLSGRSVRIGQFLSPRDLPRSADHRHAFAYDSAARDLKIIAHHHPSLLKQSAEQLDHRSRPPCSANASTKAQPKRLAGIHAEIELVERTAKLSERCR